VAVPLPAAREPAAVSLAEGLEVAMVVAVDVADLQGLVIHDDHRSGLHAIHAHLLEGQRGSGGGA